MEWLPILFSPSMVKEILDGRKTQTRRIINPQPPRWNWTNVESTCLDGLQG